MPRMSKTTYEQFAELVAGVEMPDKVFYDLLGAMIEVFIADNARFNATLFVEWAEIARSGEVYSSVRCGEV